MKTSFEPEANILSWELTSGQIAYAKETGGVIIHFTEGNVPVFIEVLKASKFLMKFSKISEVRPVVNPAPNLG